MDNKYDEKFIIMKSAIEVNKLEIKANKKDSDEKLKKIIE